MFGCFGDGGRRSKSGGSVRSGEDNGRGTYAAVARDARMALECERISACKATLNSGNAEEGAAVRSRALMLLGYSLLRRGIVEGVSDALEGSIDEAKGALACQGGIGRFRTVRNAIDPSQEGE